MRRTMTALSCLRSGGVLRANRWLSSISSKRGKALRIAVVRRGRQEQLVFKVRHEQTKGLGPHRIGGVTTSARRSAVMGLVDDQQIELARESRLVRPGQKSRGTAAVAAPV